MCSIDKHEVLGFNMNSSFQVHNIKISLKIKSPYILYCNEIIAKNKKIVQKNFGNFRIVYSHFTYVFFNTSNNILHCNVTNIKSYNQIHTCKKVLNDIFPKLNILSTKVDNICGTKYIGGNICLDDLFKCLVESNCSEFKINYNSQKFPGLFIKFDGRTLNGTLIVFKSGKINTVGLKRPKHFIKLEEWIKNRINYV